MDLFTLANSLSTVDRCIAFLFETEMLEETFFCHVCGQECELTEVVRENDEEEFSVSL